MPKGSAGVPRPARARNIKQKHLIYTVVRFSPGIRMIDVAKRMDKPRGTIQSALGGMDSAGLLLSEDEKGGLYPFRIISQQDALALQRQIWN